MYIELETMIYWVIGAYLAGVFTMFCLLVWGVSRSLVNAT